MQFNCTVNTLVTMINTEIFTTEYLARGSPKLKDFDVNSRSDYRLQSLDTLQNTEKCFVIHYNHSHVVTSTVPLPMLLKEYTNT